MRILPFGGVGLAHVLSIWREIVTIRRRLSKQRAETQLGRDTLLRKAIKLIELSASESGTSNGNF